MKEPKCQMTMGDYGNYFKCGKPAKFTHQDQLRGKMLLCGVHAKAIEKRNGKPCEPINLPPA